MSKKKTQPAPVQPEFEPSIATKSENSNGVAQFVRAHKVAVALLGLVVAVLAVFGSLQTLKWWPFNSPGPQDLAAKYDETNPAEECAGEGKAVTTTQGWPLYTPSGVEVGLAELRRSQDCNTSWLRVTTTLATGTVTKIVRRPESAEVPPGEVSTTDITGLGAGPNYESFSDQLYANGCFEVEVQIFDEAGSLYSELKPTSAC